MGQKEEIIYILPIAIRKIIEKSSMDFNKLQEIRMRIHAPILFIYDNKECFLSADGTFFEEKTKKSKPVQISREDMNQTLNFISKYSLYAFEDEIRQGFITVPGGHRIGLAGKTITERSYIKNVKYISFLNIRISHQVKGCAQKILPFLFERGEFMHTMIISPPCCGKTTMLRDVIRNISNGTKDYRGRTIGVVDERSEIGACYMGIPQNDLGIRTDVLDCCPKTEGMMMMLRSMAPEVIAVDEIGSRQDLEAVETVINCGVKLIVTVHASSIEDIKKKPALRTMLEEKMFQRYVILSNRKGVGSVEYIFDNMGNALYRGC